MGKRVTLKDVKHVDLEAAEFLLEIAQNPDWTIQDIGCYFVLNLHLYTSGGFMELDIEKFAKFCRLNEEEFETIWQKLETKFNRKKSSVFQKRVLKELRAARARMQAAVDAGLKGALKRWQPYSNPNSHPNGVAIAKRNETKRNKTKLYEEGKSNHTVRSSKQSPSRSSKNSPSSSLRFADALEKIIRPKSESDLKAFLNLHRWLERKIKDTQFDRRAVYEQILGYARKAQTGRNIRKPIAVFFATLRRELGYQGQG